MDLLEINFRLEEATTRIEQCIPLFGAMCEGEAGEALQDFLFNVDQAELQRLFPWCDHNFETQGEFSREHVENFVAELFEKCQLGFLVQFATPVMRTLGGGGFAYSWGRYYTHWVYGKTLEDAIDQGVAWTAECRASDEARAA